MTGAFAAEAEAIQLVPTAETMSRLTVRLNAVPQSGGSCTFILLKNGVATLATCTILGANTICQDLVNSVAFAANDRTSILVVPNNTPGPRQMSWTAVFTATP
jgi:hypothetical protein